MGIIINGQNDTIGPVDNSMSLLGNVSIGGTMTIEDFTNIDSVGIITARNGLHVTGGKVSVGSANPSGNLNISYLQVGKGQVSSDHSLYNYNTSFTNNAYQNGNGTFAHITSRAVGVINLQDNVFTFSNGPGGTVGQSATLTERLRIASDGNMGLGTNSLVGNAANVYLTVNGSNLGGIALKANGTTQGYLQGTSSLIRLSSDGAKPITFDTNGSERLRVDSSGRVSLNNNSRPASDASEGAQLRVTGTPLTRNQYYSPAGDYFASFGYTDNTYTKSWIAVDSSYNKTSSVSSGIFLSAFHSDANGSACGHTIKNVRTDAGGLIFSSVHAASSTGNPAVETERVRISSAGDATFKNKVNIGHSHSGSEILSLGKSSGTSYMAFHNGGANMGFIGYASELISGGGTNELGIRSQDDISFATGGNSETLRITSAGDVQIPDGNLVVASGHGIDFSANSNASGMASELLDDYEEGTFTPTVSVEGESNAATDKQYGRYIKVGNKVTVWCYIQLNGTPSGRQYNRAWQHGGLPFSQRNTAGGFDVGGPILYWTIDSTAALSGTAPYHLQARLFNNSSGGRIRGTDSSNNQNGQNLSLLLKDNTEYSYTFTYEVG